MFSKRHYEILAAAILRQINVAPKDDRVMVVRSVAYELASALKTDNPRFDAERFYMACGVGAPRQ